jgi:hypothetical protein
VAYSDDLLSSARKQLGKGQGRPRYSDVNRAISTAYYGLFDEICQACANKVAGVSNAGQRPDENWTKIYRSLDHTHIGKILAEVTKPPQTPSKELLQIRTQFFRLKAERLDADYNPSVVRSKPEALALIDDAQEAIQALRNMSRDDQTSLVVALVIRKSDRSFA